ncbi:YadA-like family protein [Bartonella bovis]|uniref:YadA-like family protein n=1 Tax=Bartonella bovis TaxID=155194 RepID=UPI001AEC3A51|nr:YadA-like family protein [Bartonella bovis]
MLTLLLSVSPVFAIKNDQGIERGSSVHANQQDIWGAWQLSVNSGGATKVTSKNTIDLIGSKNIKIARSGDKITFDLNKELQVSSLLVGNALLKESSLLIVGGPKITSSGIDAFNKKITDVADGVLSSRSKDAVNAGQVYTLNSDIAKYLGGGASILAGIEPTYTIQEQRYNNVGSTFDGVNNALSKLSSKIDDVANALSDGLVQQNFPSQLITIGGQVEGNKISITNKKGVSRVLSGVKDGELSDKSTDAVTGKQLYSVSNKFAAYLGSGAKVRDSILLGPQYTLSRVSTNGEVRPDYFSDVGSAFTELDLNIRNVNSRLTHVSTHFTTEIGKISTNLQYNTLVWRKSEQAFVALHTEGRERKNSKLTFLEDGDIAHDSTDAITGKQLYEMSTTIARYLGSDADVLEGKAPMYIIQGRGHTGVEAALKGINSKLTELSERVGNVKSTVGNSLVAQDSGLHIITIGKDVGGAEIKIANSRGEARKLTGLKDGAVSGASTEAVTGSQFYSINTTIAKYFGGGAEYNGQWKEPMFTIANFGAKDRSRKQTYNNVADAFNAVNSSISGVNDHIQQVEVQVKSNGLNWDDSQRAYDANHNSRPGKITNVANGAVAQGSTDVVTGDQLWATNEKANKLENRIDNVVDQVDILNDRVVTYDKDADGNKMNSITLAGGNESDPVLIDNVADGKIEKSSKQAVNGGQLHDYTEEQMRLVLADANKYTDKKIEDVFNSAVARANTYTDMKFNALNYRVENVQKEARQAAAIGLAVANLNYINTPGMLSVAFGSGVWRDQSAIAFGAGYMSEDGRMRSNLSVTTSGGHWGVGAGLSIALK